MIRPGFVWDAARRTWKPVDYSAMTAEQLAERRKQANDKIAETEAQLKGILPAAQAQGILNLSMTGLRELMITLAKKAPGALAGLV